MELSDNLPDIEQIVSCIIDPEVISIKAINTMKGVSYEGQYLSGKKAVIELKLKQKILYVAEHSTQSVHVIENEFFQSVYIVIPCKIEGTAPEYLIKHKYLKPEIIIEDIYFKQTGKRSIFKNICLMIKLELSPVYEVCYNIHQNCSFSNLSMMYEDGSNNTQITFNKNCKIIKPLWSPNGREIAFLSNCEGSRMLYIYCIKTCSIKRITEPKIIKCITGFCWMSDGKKLCFTAIVGKNKEIFSIDVHTLCFEQLTFGEGIYGSRKPKNSPDGMRIAFVRCISGIEDLWIMNVDGSECKKITSCGGVKYFDWSADGRNIVYICSKEGKSDELGMINTCEYTIRILRGCEKIYKKRKVLYSPDDSHIAFIGCEMDSENIYIYHLEQCVVTNITKYSSNTAISDLVWHVDGKKIYYTCKEYFHFNIYSILIKNYIKTQLTCITASNMELSYRPQIC